VCGLYGGLAVGKSSLIKVRVVGAHMWRMWCTWRMRRNQQPCDACDCMSVEFVVRVVSM
jgi:hypothetical protein